MAARMTTRDQNTRIAGGYSRGQRFVETACVALFFVACALLSLDIARAQLTGPLMFTLVAGLIASALLSDLISATVHWACDTWGTVHTPIMGRVFIRQFREHHTDAQEICRHDFVE